MKHLVLSFFLFPLIALGQFDPAGGKAGSKAVHRDNSSISYWGDSLVIQRGPMQIGDSSGKLASTGTANDGIGKADNYPVSLGDGGSATYYFKEGIRDITGPDFVVFENGFSWIGGYFLELAFVEVSSNGTDFIRFPAISVADTASQIENLSYMECEWYHNLAGKHQAPYGTPFDLNELKDSSKLDVQNIHYIRVVDVVGSIDKKYANRDSKNNIINDPWPTNFEPGGFDLDAVGVIKFALSEHEQIVNIRLIVGNLVLANGAIRLTETVETLTIIDALGKTVLHKNGIINEINAPSSVGYFTVVIQKNNHIYTEKICVISE